MLTALTPMLALLADRVLGEPRRAHPLVLFGRWASVLEARCNPPSSLSDRQRQWRGALCAVLLIALPTLAAHWLAALPYIGGLCALALLYLCLGLQSLHEHARAIATPLLAGDLVTAREKVGWIVSRDTAGMDETQITRATLESVLENGNDAVFATLFWFFLLGAPGAVLLRTANTLDAMWGYRTPQYLHFGRFAARFDDVLNAIPARLTALSFAMLGQTATAFACWRAQAGYCASPNGGPVMTAGAGSLGVVLGGGASYHGEWKDKPLIGAGRHPQATDIEAALRLVRHAAWLWVALYAIACSMRGG